MIIIGVDFHPEFQQMAVLDSDTGELQSSSLHFDAQLLIAKLRFKAKLRLKGYQCGFLTEISRYIMQRLPMPAQLAALPEPAGPARHR